MRAFVSQIFLTISFLSLNRAAHAQTVTNAESTVLQPTISRDSEGFSSCGVRATVIAGAGKHGLVYDFSVNIYPDTMSGMVKAGKYTYSAMLSKNKLSAVQPAPTAFWIAAADQGIALTPFKLIPADSAGFILGGTELVPALETMIDMATGKQMQFALRYEEEKLERVISFAATMPQTDFAALMSCIQGAQSRIEKAQNLEPSPPPK